MKTIGNNIPFTGAEFDSEKNIGYYYEEGFIISVLFFANDQFEYHSEGHTQKEKDMFYNEMTESRSRWMYDAKMN